MSTMHLLSPADIERKLDEIKPVHESIHRGSSEAGALTIATMAGALETAYVAYTNIRKVLEFDNSNANKALYVKAANIVLDLLGALYFAKETTRAKKVEYLLQMQTLAILHVQYLDGRVLYILQ